MIYRYFHQSKKSLCLSVLLIVACVSPLCASLIQNDTIPRGIAAGGTTYTSYGNFHMKFTIPDTLSFLLAKTTDSTNTEVITDYAIADAGVNVAVANLILVSRAAMNTSFTFLFSWNELKQTPDIGNAISYMVAFRDSANTLNKPATGTKILSYTYVKADSDYTSTKLGSVIVNMDEDSYQSALSGEYSDTITVTLQGEG